MKFCDVKMADIQGKTAKAGWQAPGELFYRRRAAIFTSPFRARWKSRPDGFRCLVRSIHYGLRHLHSRIGFSTTRRIHAIIDDTP